MVKLRTISSHKVRGKKKRVKNKKHLLSKKTWVKFSELLCPEKVSITIKFHSPLFRTAALMFCRENKALVNLGTGRPH